MRWSELDVQEAPKRGHLLAYTRKQVIFKPYESLEGAKQMIDETEEEPELLEVHLFDENREYRAIATRSRRFPEGRIETLTDFPEKDEECFAETVFLENNQGKITVLNHVSYDKDTGMATVDNYRLRR